MPDDERVAVSVLNNGTTQGRAEPHENSAPFFGVWSARSGEEFGQKLYLVSGRIQVGNAAGTGPDGLPRVGRRRGSNGSGWNAARQDVPFGHRQSRLLASPRWARGATRLFWKFWGNPNMAEFGL